MLGQPEGDMELGAEMPGDLEEEESRGGHPGERLQSSNLHRRWAVSVEKYSQLCQPGNDSESLTLNSDKIYEE